MEGAAERLGECVFNEYDVLALLELVGEVILVLAILLFFQYADKGRSSRL